uniref:Ig-like domain-containing protein n=2 Tax=Macrostomum lignano TaxID=282301 RepID=A0A1I8JDI1_9PLAT
RFLLLVALACCLATTAAAASASAESDKPQGEKLTGTHVKAITEEEQLLPGAPRFVEQPRPVYYVTRSTPASIECAADQAMYVTVHCNGRALNKKVEVASDHERPERQRFHALVDFNDVRDWSSSSYYCNCEAWGKIPALKNELRKVISSSGYVRLAYFESDRFQFDPMPRSVPLDASEVTLSCTPPKGSPKPKVKWLKDGKPLDVRSQSDRITIDHQAQLIIRPLRLDDRGNYSCLAEIPGLTLASGSAELNIYGNLLR